MDVQVYTTTSNLASAMLNSKIRPRAVVGYGVKIFRPSPPNYVTRSPGRCQGHVVSDYIDDTYHQQQLFNDALNSLHACKSLFTSLGLLIHPEKSLDIPSEVATVLGFIINSLDMTISLTTEKKSSFRELCHRIMQSNQITIRDLARLNGKLVLIQFSWCGLWPSFLS